MDKYSESSTNLSRAIDIAILSFEQYLMEEWDTETLQDIIDTYKEFKHRVDDAEAQFRNQRSLSYIIAEVFTYFQEGDGQAVNAFWEKIYEEKLPYKRENRLLKIIKRNKIKNQSEYDFVIDIIVPYQQQGIINEKDLIILNRLIMEFENK